MKSVMKTILVISNEDENPDEIAAKYSEEYEVEPYFYMRPEDGETLRISDLSTLEMCFLCEDLMNILSDAQKEYLQERCVELHNMSGDEYFKKATNNCDFDEEGNAWSDKNTHAFYKFPKCYQERLEKTGEEAQFSNPFMLKDGGVAYRAHFNDIDWELMHNHNRDVYEGAWEVCVEGREPEDLQEIAIKEQMKNRNDYFLNFTDKEEYVDHSTMFFMYGIATNNEFIHRNELEEKEIDYIRRFYNDYIKKIKGNPLLSIYEVRSLG